MGAWSPAGPPGAAEGPAAALGQLAPGPETFRIYADHYNRARPHRTLGPPLTAAEESIAVNPLDVGWRDLLDGLIHEYDGLTT